MWQMLLSPGREPSVVFWGGFGIWRCAVVLIKGVLEWFAGFFADCLSRSRQRAAGAQIPPSGSKTPAKSIPQGRDAGKDGQPHFLHVIRDYIALPVEAF